MKRVGIVHGEEEEVVVVGGGRRVAAIQFGKRGNI